MLDQLNFRVNITPFFFFRVISDYLNPVCDKCLESPCFSCNVTMHDLASCPKCRSSSSRSTSFLSIVLNFTDSVVALSFNLGIVICQNSETQGLAMTKEQLIFLLTSMR